MSAVTKKQGDAATAVGLPQRWNLLGSEGDLLQLRPHQPVDRGGNEVDIEWRGDGSVSRVLFGGLEVRAARDVMAQCCKSGQVTWDDGAPRSIQHTQGRCRVEMAVAKALLPNAPQTAEYRYACQQLMGAPLHPKTEPEQRLVLCARETVRELRGVLDMALTRHRSDEAVEALTEKVKTYAPGAKSQQDIDQYAELASKGQ